MIAQVIINSNVKNLNKIFDYNVPSQMEGTICVGDRIFVPFGNKKTLEEGFVIGLKEKSEFKVKDIAGIQDGVKLTEFNIELAKLMARRYFCNISDCIKLMLPPGTSTKVLENRIKDKTLNFVYLKKDIIDIEEDIENGIIKSDKQKRVLNFLIQNDGIQTVDLEMFTDTTSAVLKALEKKDYIEIIEQKVERNPFENKDIKPTINLKLTDEQQEAFDSINFAIEHKEHIEALLYGVTGSGKTEVYLQLIGEVLKKERTLWERKYDHYDFLTARLGFGKMESFVTLEFPEEHFELEPDDLRKVGDELVENSKYLDNVPITLNLVKSRFSSFVGNKDYLRKFFEGVLLQFLTYHSYDILNIVVLANDEDSLYWKKFNSIPHFWNTSKTIRFIGTNSEEIAYISNYLLKVYQSRQNTFNDAENKNTNENPYPRFMPYYLIVTDSIETAKKSSIINELLHQPLNYGFSLVILSESLDNLPNEINTFVNIDPRVSTLFYNTLISTNQTEFLPDIINKDLSECYLKLCNVPIDIAEGKYNLPQKYAFLEMYDVGNVNQLNITNRWKESNVTQTLAAPVGVNEEGELFKIDLHEKAHGPHGLVAGMTGSGKSEWIVTYILSMCINYHPDEVQFVLIDYKGGGLAGTFENKETGFKLPHLSGTITNLDITEINRSLASINSE